MELIKEKPEMAARRAAVTQTQRSEAEKLLRSFRAFQLNFLRLTTSEPWRKWATGASCWVEWYIANVPKDLADAVYLEVTENKKFWTIRDIISQTMIEAKLDFVTSKQMFDQHGEP